MVIHDDGGPLIHNGREDEQRSFDSTCRKFRRFPHPIPALRSPAYLQIPRTRLPLNKSLHRNTIDNVSVARIFKAPDHILEGQCVELRNRLQFLERGRERVGEASERPGLELLGLRVVSANLEET